jgi:hypothetical protein
MIVCELPKPVCELQKSVVLVEADFRCSIGNPNWGILATLPIADFIYEQSACGIVFMALLIRVKFLRSNPFIHFKKTTV